MKASEIRDMKTDDLGGKLEQLQKQLFDLRSQSVTEKVENTSARRNVRKDIARIKTIMVQKQLKDD